MGSTPSQPSTTKKNKENSQIKPNTVGNESKGIKSENDKQNENGSVEIDYKNNETNGEKKVNSKGYVLESKESEQPTTATLTGNVPKSADGVIISVPNLLDKDSSQSNTLYDDENDSKVNQKIGTEEEKRKVEENRQKDEKRKEIQTLLFGRFQDLQCKYKDTEMFPDTVVKASVKCSNHSNDLLDTSYKENVALSLREKETTLKSTKQKKAKLLNRLSELASVRLRHNNPDIADLSDENRATKLAERLSELYDNEWTDLFEATKKQNAKRNNVDRCIAEGLRDVLKFCYDECRRIVRDQRDRLGPCLKANHTEDFQALPEGLQMRIKEFQKIVPQYYLPKIKTVISKNASEGLKQNMVVESSKKTKKHFDPYINLCIDITLHTQIQDPPLKLDFDSKDSDESSFRPYTSTGPQLDYVLWPALLLHEKGSVVAKGVAQFKARSEKKTEEQNTSENTANVTDSDWNTYM